MVTTANKRIVVCVCVCVWPFTAIRKSERRARLNERVKFRIPTLESHVSIVLGQRMESFLNDLELASVVAWLQSGTRADRNKQQSFLKGQRLAAQRAALVWGKKHC